jgi:HPt (histidine-containing phosphotransfer) domain-containing protein
MPIQPVIDPLAIQSLRDLCPGDNDAFLREMVEVFVADTPLRIAELEESLASDDGVRFTRAAHSIKGSSANLGASALKAVAERVERESRARPIAQLAPMVEEIRAEFARARAELERLAAPGGGGQIT